MMSATVGSCPFENGCGDEPPERAAMAPSQLIATIIDCSVDPDMSKCACFNRYAGYSSSGDFVRYLTPQEVKLAEIVHAGIVVQVGPSGFASRPQVGHTLHTVPGVACIQDERVYLSPRAT